MQVKFTIDGRIPSKKNSHVIKKNRSTGVRYIGPDNDYIAWERENADQCRLFFRDTLSGKEHLHIHYRFSVKRNQKGDPSYRRWDVSNKIESINDMLVRAGMIDDDNHTILRYGTWEVIDSDVTEVEVTIHE